MADVGDREARVLDRIEAHRRRAPRLTDDVVTMAHGAGGKASAALVDAVFLEAFAARRADAAGRCRHAVAADGERLAFTTDSFVVQPLRFPGGSIGHLAVHGTVNDLAVLGRPAAMAVGRLRHRGGVPGRRAAGDRRRHGRGRDRRRRHHRHGRHQGGGPGRGRRPLRHDRRGRRPASRSHRSVPSASRWRRPVGVGHDRRPRHGRHAGPGDLALDADIRSDTAAVNGLVEALFDAGRRRGGCGTRQGEGWAPSATSWPATPTSP